MCHEAVVDTVSFLLLFAFCILQPRCCLLKTIPSPLSSLSERLNSVPEPCSIARSEGPRESFLYHAASGSSHHASSLKFPDAAWRSNHFGVLHSAPQLLVMQTLFRRYVQDDRGRSIVFTKKHAAIPRSGEWSSMARSGMPDIGFLLMAFDRDLSIRE